MCRSEKHRYKLHCAVAQIIKKLLSISACDVLHEPKENKHDVWSHSVLKCCANGKANTYEHSLIIT